MQVSFPKFESKGVIQQNRLAKGQPISNEKDELINNRRQEKIALTDITMQQWFWDKAILS